MSLYFKLMTTSRIITSAFVVLRWHRSELPTGRSKGCSVACRRSNSMPSRCSGSMDRWFHTRYDCSLLANVPVECPVASALLLSSFYKPMMSQSTVQVQLSRRYCSVVFVTATYAIIRRRPTCSSCRASSSAPRGSTPSLPQVMFRFSACVVIRTNAHMSTAKRVDMCVFTLW
jgi:hypothetical protein